MLTNIITAIVTDIEILFIQMFIYENSISVTILTTIFNMIVYIDIIGKNFGQLNPEK